MVRVLSSLEAAVPRSVFAPLQTGARFRAHARQLLHVAIPFDLRTARAVWLPRRHVAAMSVACELARMVVALCSSTWVCMRDTM